MDVVINYSRPGKGTKRYVEELVLDDKVRIRTMSRISPERSQQWCEEFWWHNGYIPRGVLIGSETKFLFYREWFCAMQLLDTTGANLGYYVDVTTPVRRLHGEYFLTDLYLDFWIAPDGKYYELDQDEFEEGFRAGHLTPFQYKKAAQVFKKLNQMITNSELLPMLS